MRGLKAKDDEDYEIGADAEDARAAATDKQLTSQYRGVCWNRKNKRWQAAINSGKRYVYLGSFLSEHEAARAFDQAAVKLRGVRAKLNFPYSEYVDEHGNLLEDPKMKDVLGKIDASMQEKAEGGSGGRGGRHGGGGGGGGSGGAGAALGAGLGAGLGSALGGDDNSGLSEAQMLPFPLALPLPGLPQQPGYEGGAGGRGATPPHGYRRRQYSPLRLAPGGGRLLQGSGDEGGGAGPEWRLQGSGGSGGSGGGLPPGGHGPPPPLWQQHSHNPAYNPHDAPPFRHPFPDPVTSGPQQGLAGGGGGGPLLGGQGRGGPSAGPWASRQAPLPALGGAGGSSGGGGGGGGGYDSSGPVAPVLHLGEGPGGGGAAAAAAAAPPPPGSHLARGSSGGGSDSALHRTILRELPPGCQLLAMVPNRFANSKEDMCGALYLDSTVPGQVGSSVWTGSSIIKMGLYDTERDARQAAIKCMQLYWAFCSDEWRVDFYNALAAMSGAAGVGGDGPYEGGGAAAGAAGGGSGGGGGAHEGAAAAGGALRAAAAAGAQRRQRRRRDARAPAFPSGPAVPPRPAAAAVLQPQPEPTPVPRKPPPAAPPAPLVPRRVPPPATCARAPARPAAAAPPLAPAAPAATARRPVLPLRRRRRRRLSTGVWQRAVRRLRRWRRRRRPRRRPVIGAAAVRLRAGPGGAGRGRGRCGRRGGRQRRAWFRSVGPDARARGGAAGPVAAAGLRRGRERRLQRSAALHVGPQRAQGQGQGPGRRCDARRRRRHAGGGWDEAPRARWRAPARVGAGGTSSSSSSPAAAAASGAAGAGG